MLNIVIQGCCFLGIFLNQNTLFIYLFLVLKIESRALCVCSTTELHWIPLKHLLENFNDPNLSPEGL
jgi:hypothetical protein